MAKDTKHSLLPLPVPGDPMQRMVLVALRRMATHGLRDAQATMLVINHLGKDFRQPLVLLRAFVSDLAQASQRTITVAPCCALRMTGDEGRILRALQAAAGNPAEAARCLSTIAGTHHVSWPLASAAAFANALANLGRPLAT